MTLTEFVRRSGPRFVLICTVSLTAGTIALAQGEAAVAVHAPDNVAAGSVTSTGVAPSEEHSVVPARRLTLDERLHIYTHSLTSLESVLGPAFGAAVNQARNEPPEWGQGTDAYAVRFASGYGRMLIGHTIRFGVAALDHEDPRFYPSGKTGFWPRTKSAVVHVFIAPTDSGGEIPAFSRFAAIYGAAFISNAWYPSSRADTYHALLRGSTALSANIGWNVLKEFWPDIRHHHRQD